MSVLDKLRSARTRTPGAHADRLAEGSLLAQALRRAQSERNAARASAEAVPGAEAGIVPGEEAAIALRAEAPEEAAIASPPEPQPPRSGHGTVALLLALAILAAAIAIWHSAPSSYDPAQPPSSLKLERSLKTGG